MTSKVYFCDAHSQMGSGLLKKLRKIVSTGLAGIVTTDDLVAVKVHWGEAGNLAYLRPPYARLLVDHVHEAGGRAQAPGAGTDPARLTLAAGQSSILSLGS